jgi:hypothetical protein
MRPDHPTGDRTMAKERHSTKETKKQPALSLKEKRAAKKTKTSGKPGSTPFTTPRPA